MTYAGAPGTVRFVKIDGVCHPPEEQTGWPEEDGFMLHVPTTMGLVYLPSGEDEEDLDFLSRG
ncbi:MAG TPA: hypothetical protein VL243_00735 [Vicinamibacterales bacterium]|nr:hypothetical protein [Vicinamibacterales bacterium]